MAFEFGENQIYTLEPKLHYFTLATGGCWLAILLTSGSGGRVRQAAPASSWIQPGGFSVNYLLEF